MIRVKYKGEWFYVSEPKDTVNYSKGATLEGCYELKKYTEGINPLDKHQDNEDNFNVWLDSHGYESESTLSFWQNMDIVEYHYDTGIYRFTNNKFKKNLGVKELIYIYENKSQS
jgi:hypothetical protein